MQWAAHYHNKEDVLKNILDQFSVKLSLIIYLQ